MSVSGAPLLLLLLLLLPLVLTSPLFPSSLSHAPSSERSGPPDTLRLVHVLYRHGARSPIGAYPTNPNRDPWPMGLGQLTNEGKRGELELGRFLRRRYDGFLPAMYHQNYTRVESTDKDRCLMSAQVSLAGLFPPQREDVWDDDLPWQPIPVHTVPLELDLKLRPDKACAAWRREWKRQLKSPQIVAVDAANAELYAYLSEHSGVNVTSVEDVTMLLDTLEIEARQNLTVPSWALAVPPGHSAPAFPDLMRPLNELTFALYGASEKLRRLGGGSLLKDMVENMRDRVEDRLQPEGRRMFVYSGHDINIVYLLTALQLYNTIQPPAASCVLVELHSEPVLGPTVQLFYRNDTSETPYPLQLSGCDLSCHWERFVQLTADVLPGDVQVECAAELDVSDVSDVDGGTPV